MHICRVIKQKDIPRLRYRLRDLAVDDIIQTVEFIEEICDFKYIYQTKNI